MHPFFHTSASVSIIVHNHCLQETVPVSVITFNQNVFVALISCNLSSLACLIRGFFYLL